MGILGTGLAFVEIVVVIVASVGVSMIFIVSANVIVVLDSLIVIDSVNLYCPYYYP